MARADVSSRARADYDEIVDYVAKDRPQAALRLSKKLQAKFELLAERPCSGTNATNSVPVYEAPYWGVT